MIGNTKYFLINSNLELKEYDSMDSILKQKPFAILKRVVIGAHTTDRNKYDQYSYTFYDSNGDPADLQMNGWRIRSCDKTYWKQLFFEGDWYGYLYVLHDEKRKRYSMDYYQWTTGNNFEVIDTFGEIKTVRFREFEDISSNLNIYQKFRSWSEVEQYKINHQLKLTNELLLRTNKELQEELDKLKKQP